jgi:uncharacterized protein (DUF433 family)
MMKCDFLTLTIIKLAPNCHRFAVFNILQIYFISKDYVTISSMEEQILQRITINPNVCHGKPTIRNKRYPIENMLELMASGMTNEEILADYEDLEKEDLFACLMFAAKLADVGSITELVAA